MKLCQLYGYQTSAVVCDGASANLTALKTATGSLGAYGAVAGTSTCTSKQWYPIPTPKFENPPHMDLLGHLSQPSGIINFKTRLLHSLILQT